MPGPSSHTLIWSELQQHYELQTHGKPEQCFHWGDEPAWQSWLDDHTAFAFVGQAGRISVLKEARSRGAGYWYAYRTKDRHTRKHYLGPTVKVTFDRLEGAAKVLKSEPSSAPLRTPPQKEASSVSLAETGRDGSRLNAQPQAEQEVM